MFFSTNAFLTVSGQLHAEAIMRYIKKQKKNIFFLDSLIMLCMFVLPLYLVE